MLPVTSQGVNMSQGTVCNKRMDKCMHGNKEEGGGECVAIVVVVVVLLIIIA